MNEVTYLDKTTRLGVCVECAPLLENMRHELLPIDTVVEEVRGIMLNLESNMRDMINHSAKEVGFVDCELKLSVRDPLYNMKVDLFEVMNVNEFHI